MINIQEIIFKMTEAYDNLCDLDASNEFDETKNEKTRPSNLYSRSIHHFLMYYSGFFFGGNTDTRTNPYGEYGIKVKIFLPQVNQIHWELKYQKLYQKEYSGKNKTHKWPTGTLYNYITSLRCNTEITDTELFFGYTCHQGKLHKTAFFSDGFTEDTNPIDVERKVFDPLAFKNDIKPDWYIGVSVSNELLDLSVQNKIDPLVLLRNQSTRRHQAHIHAVNGGLILD